MDNFEKALKKLEEKCKSNAGKYSLGSAASGFVSLVTGVIGFAKKVLLPMALPGLPGLLQVQVLQLLQPEQLVL